VPAEILRITDPATGATADLLASLGFNCYSWRPELADGPREMLWAHENFASGQERASGSGTPLLFPFPGRIGGARYEFEGKQYELPAGDAFGNALHGYAFDRPWRVLKATGDAVLAEFAASTDAPETLAYWPSDYRLRVRYQIASGKLTSHVEYTNTGDANLPCAFGTHAYFRIPLSDQGSAASTIITAPVDRQWDMQDMLPTVPARDIDAHTPLAQGVPLGELSFDTPCQVQAGTSPVVTQMFDPASGRTLRQTTDESFGCYVFYTPPHRQAVCIEPYTTTPDPFRLEQQGVATGLQILAPGESRATRIELEILEA